ncbi:uncharacterized protein LOC135955469 [Calliphora vicina]|uniref:uncharacterized protein LOC135955469 n=1 Tax=Calliphora vicina TaxID=7373 RepID=UPI00325A5250
MSFPNVMEKPNWLSLQMLGLRLKLHIVNCETHPDRKVLEFFEGPSAFNVDFDIEEPHIIYECLAKSRYMRYSAIIILINCYCSCRSRILYKILKAIQCNKHINYKLKLIKTTYRLTPAYKNHTNIWQTYFEEPVSNLTNNYQLENCVGYEQLNKLIDSYVMKRRHITADDRELVRDHLNFKFSQLENIFLFQGFLRTDDCYERAQTMDYILYILDCLPLISAQELCEFLPDTDYPLAVQSKGNAELYFYNVNPALAIINNNYTFTNNPPGCEIREGSENDVLKLIRELKIARIPYILTEDFSKAQLLNWIKYLANKNLKALQCLIFIMMTHATSNNIIYTHDGELNFIEDILQPIQANATLKDAHLAFVNVLCRGGLNAEYTAPDEFDLIQPTQIAQLQPNTSVFYSVPDLVISPRRPQIGTPFVESFCKSFRQLKRRSDIKTLGENICNDLKNDNYYAYLDCFDKSSELVVGDATKSYCIKPMPTSATEIIPLVESIEKEFYDLNNMKQRENAYMRPLLEMYLENTNNGGHVTSTPSLSSETATTSFCICANVNEKKFAKILEKLNYFSTELDDDEDARFIKQSKLLSKEVAFL